MVESSPETSHSERYHSYHSYQARPVLNHRKHDHSRRHRKRSRHNYEPEDEYIPKHRFQEAERGCKVALGDTVRFAGFIDSLGCLARNDNVHKVLYTCLCSGVLGVLCRFSGAQYTPWPDILVYCLMYAFWITHCLPWLVNNLDGKTVRLLFGVLLRLFAAELCLMVWGHFRGHTNLLQRALGLRPLLEPSLSWLPQVGYGLRFGVTIAALLSYLTGIIWPPLEMVKNSIRGFKKRSSSIPSDNAYQEAPGLHTPSTEDTRQVGRSLSAPTKNPVGNGRGPLYPRQNKDKRTILDTFLQIAHLQSWPKERLKSGKNKNKFRSDPPSEVDRDSPFFVDTGSHGDGEISSPTRNKRFSSPEKLFPKTFEDRDHRRVKKRLSCKADSLLSRTKCLLDHELSKDSEEDVRKSKNRRSPVNNRGHSSREYRRRGPPRGDSEYDGYDITKEPPPKLLGEYSSAALIAPNKVGKTELKQAETLRSQTAYRTRKIRYESETDS